ncbi:MAG: DUF502 domain-containing protein [Deltaproteobacteria bacterium]|nr:DUF502 domain-containing protein [Deltaproteobacteria bacterium]
MSMRKKLKNTFLTGIAAIIPIAATIYIILFIIKFLNRIVDIVPARFQLKNLLPFPIPGLDILIALILILVLGLIVKSYIGNKVVQIGERIVARIPLVSGIYGAVKKLVDALFSEKANSFKKVVLIEYPRKGLYSIAFVTGEAKGEVQQKTNQHCINLFVPTTPNPTSGFYIMVPEGDVVNLNMTVEEAFRLIISGGIIAPEKVKDAERPGEVQKTIK